MPPVQNRRTERAGRAKETMDRAIPEILRASPRARHGVHKSELIIDPQSSETTPRQRSFADSNDAIDSELKIRLSCTDTLATASRASGKPFTSTRTTESKPPKQQSNVTILNMASPLNPGGGFLNGSNGQEEFLCARTTLYPSLWSNFYCLPEVGGIYSPDVMVFRDSTLEANDLARRDRFFVDVITAGTLRFSDARGRSEDRTESCSCGISYCDRHRELVTRKIKAVLRMAQSHGAEKLILGAWGCGAYGNPAKEVAKIWRKVIAGSPRQRNRHTTLKQWEGIKEIVFAIPDRTMLREFERAFGDILTYSAPSSPESEMDELTAFNKSAESNELLSTIIETEMQIEQVSNPLSRARLREVLAGLNKQLVQGRSAAAAQDEEGLPDEDEEVDEFVVSGFPASDGEQNSYYNFDEDDIASDSSDCDQSETYDFRFHPPDSGFESATSRDESGRDDTTDFGPPSGEFDANTGWFTGSMDMLTAMLRGRGGKRSASPVALRPTSSGQDIISEDALGRYLSRYQGTDDKE